MQITQMLNRLVAYAEEHFQHEEGLMEEAGYPRLPQHHELHEKLVSAVFELNEKLAAGAAIVDAKTLLFVKNWLLNHILQEDMDIGDFLRRKAAQAAKAARQIERKEEEEKSAAEAARKAGEGGKVAPTQG